MKKKYLIIFFVFTLLSFCVSFIGLVFRLQARLNQSLEKGWLKPPLELYTDSETITTGMVLSPKALKQKLKQRYIVFKEETQELKTISWHQTGVEKGATSEVFSSYKKDMKHKNLNKIGLETKKKILVQFKGPNIYALYKDQKPVKQIVLKPFLFAQYEKGELVLKKISPLSKVPFHCRMAVLAAEDHHFITHGGINFKAILRAMYKNLRAGHLKEGGSTITQQLVKNLFFDSKKSFWRKFQEQIMAFLLEIRQDRQNKDQILTSYLNMIYMGQRGLFRVHGFGSAAEYYIGKPLFTLNLSECALLAGIIKSPGRYKPSPTNQKIKKRRDYILNTLFKKQQEWMLSISPKELAKAKAYPILKPQAPLPPPPYFTDTVYRKIKEQKWPLEKGLKVWTTLYPDFQKKASQSLKQGLKWLEKTRFPQKYFNKKEHLQAVLINVELTTGAVRAIMGGRDFKKSQFNRALKSQRQIGSLIKPVVLLSALIEKPKLHPLSLVEDYPWTYKYDSKSWSPKNYKEQYRGLVPLYKLLNYSLNAGTARLGLDTGLKPLIKTLKKLGGLKGEITAHPSLTLGALELSPWQVSQIFLNLANMGEPKTQHIIKKVTDLNHNIIYEKPPDLETPLLDPKKVALVVGMLREVARTGTARWLKSFPVEVAGKTGTTNEEKDAWFAGFSPEFLTVVWVGFDDNRSHYLTGAGGALPLWESFMKKIISLNSKKIFDWPEGVEEKPVKQKNLAGKELTSQTKKSPQKQKSLPKLESLQKKENLKQLESPSKTEEPLQLIFEK